ncbi:MAG: SDR family NAD(P)-dependent oxidoreductase, partial [Pseudomonadota bacterium]
MSGNPKVLVVTGGSRGIGAATARAGAAAGYVVAVNYNNSRAAAEAVVREIEDRGGRAVAIEADVSTEDGAAKLFAETDAKLGTPTALFNNAGIIHENCLIGDVDAATIDRLWRVNITSQFLCAREAVRRMATDRGGSGGAIVNMSSAAARI